MNATNENNKIDSSPKVLFLTRFDFTHDLSDGGMIVSDRNFKSIVRIFGRENVDLNIISPYRDGVYDSIHYYKACTGLVQRYLSYFVLKDRLLWRQEKRLVERINKLQPGIIFFDGSTFGQLVSKLQVSSKTILFFHNIERQYTWEQVTNHSILCIFRYIATRYNETRLIEYAQHYICMNDRDSGLLHELYGKQCEYLFPASFEDKFSNEKQIDFSQKQSTGKKKLLFVGSYLAHNYKGLYWFIENVLPHCDCILEIVGKNMEIMRENVHSDKVNVIGTVDDLVPYYCEADAVVMPIFMGGGMKVKTAEALMYGKAIIASDEALRGYDINAISNIFRCNSSEEFIVAIEHIDTNTKYHQDVRKMFLSRYSEDTVQKSFRIFMHKVIDV